jgi:tetratricopeptide (TPR) repeat protein
MLKIITSTKKSLYIISPFLILFIIPWVTYFNTLNNDFVFDDLPLIQGNETLASPKNENNIISATIQKYGYRPVRALSYAIDYRFSGLNPLSYHISNIAYHTINTLLIYLITLFLLRNRVTAFFAALLFAVHPIHTDSVTYMAGRRDILFTLFYLLGFYTFLRYRDTQRFTFMLILMAAYLLSLGSKEMGVTLPAIFLIYDLVNDLPQKTKRFRLNIAKEILASLKKIWIQHKYFYSTFFMGALAFTYHKVFISSPSHQNEYYGDSLLITFLTTGKIIIHYIKLLLLPVNLTADYSYDAFPLASLIFEWSTFSPVILLLLILLFLLRVLTKQKWIAFGGFWFFITLLPVSHIIPHHELLAEHYLYLPSYGFCLIIALFLTALLEDKRYSPFIFSTFIIITLLFSLRIIDRNRDWKDGSTLWSKTVKTVPRCARAHNNLGAEYIKEGKYKEAVTHLKKALKIKRDYAEAYSNLGLAYKEQGLYNYALRSFKKARKFKKRYFEALNNMANTLELKGKYYEAIRLFKRILKKKPGFAQAHNNLGIAYQRKGQLELAKESFIKVLQLDPYHLEAHNNLGIWYKNTGLYDKAIEEFKQVLTLKPDYAEVHCNLGAVYNNKGWYDEAINEFKEALRLKPHFVDAINNLGNAYKGKGWYNQAIEAFKKTLEINQDLAIPHLNLALIYLYQKNDNKKALYHFERALEIEPNFPQADAIKEKIEEIRKNVPLA